MAITTHTSDANAGQADGVTATWAAIPNGNQGDAHGGPYLTASFVATGTFGAGGSVRLEGSNDGANWFALSSTALTAAGIFAALGAAEHPKFIRPSVTAGDGTTAITVVGFFASARRVN
jgi:hypothetical protein